jgi:hypothetical protein
MSSASVNGRKLKTTEGQADAQDGFVAVSRRRHRNSGRRAHPIECDVLYATGFEEPSFVPGPIDGQSGWFVFSASGEISAPVIETTVVNTGAQAVGVPGSVSGQTGSVFAPNFTSPVVDLSTDIFLASSSGESTWQFATTGANDTGYAGGIDINGTSIVAISSGFPVVGALTRDAWHHVDVVLDYLNQTFALDLDGSMLAADLSFCGNNFGPCNGAPVAELGWALFNTFGNGNDAGYVDNFSIATVSAAIPEPASIMLLGIALVGLGVTRQRRDRCRRDAAAERHSAKRRLQHG